MICKRVLVLTLLAAGMAQTAGASLAQKKLMRKLDVITLRNGGIESQKTKQLKKMLEAILAQQAKCEKDLETILNPLLKDAPSTQPNKYTSQLLRQVTQTGELNLCKINLTDDILLNILDLINCLHKKITCLNLSDNKNLKKLPENIKNLTKLESLYINNTEPLFNKDNKDNLSLIFSLSTLTYLDLNNCNIKSEQLEGIERLTELKELDIHSRGAYVTWDYTLPTCFFDQTKLTKLGKITLPSKIKTYEQLKPAEPTLESKLKAARPKLTVSYYDEWW